MIKLTKKLLVECQFRCPHCLNIEDVPMFYETGGWFFYDDSDIFCPECNIEMDSFNEDTQQFEQLDY